MLVTIVRSKGDWQKAIIDDSKIWDFHWSKISGGAQINSGMWGLYGRIWCTDLNGQAFGHSGIHGPCPHEIKILIQKCDNEESVYNILAARAGEKPSGNGYRIGATNIVRRIVAENPGITQLEVYEMMKGQFEKLDLQNTIRYLKKFKGKLAKLRDEKCGRTYRLYIVDSHEKK